MREEAMPLGRLRRGLLVVALLLGAAPAGAQDALRRPAGYVVAVETTAADPEAAAHVLRDGQPVPVQIGGALFDGDRVVVQDPGTIVAIETITDRHVRIDAAHSPHAVTGELPAGGRFSAIAAMVGELFRGKPEARTVNLIGRTDPLRLPLGRGVPQRVAPGARLWVGWQGGAAPYVVEIREAAAPATVLASTPAAGRTAALVLPQTAAGALQLLVRDADGAEATIDLRPSLPPPAVPDALRTGAPTPAFGQVASALWLLEQKPAEWDLAAAALAAEAGDYPAAQELLRRLAAGKRPEPRPEAGLSR